MKLSYQRSGGIAGISKRAVIDTERLPAGERAAWEQLVADSDFFALPAAPGPSDPRQRDAFAHAVTVEDGARRHTVQLQGTSASPALRTLLERLQAASTRAPE